MFLNKYETAEFLSFFNLFTIFFLRHVSVIFQKWETKKKNVSSLLFVCFKRSCKIDCVILKCAKMH